MWFPSGVASMNWYTTFFIWAIALNVIRILEIIIAHVQIIRSGMFFFMASNLIYTLGPITCIWYRIIGMANITAY